MVGRKVKGRSEIYIELDLFTGYGSVAAGLLARCWMDSAGLDRIERGKSAKVLGCEGQISRRRGCVAIGEFHIRWRIDAGGDLRCGESGRPAGPPNIRVGWKYSVDLDPDFADISYRRAARQQAGKCRAGDRGGCCENKIVGRLDFEFARTLRPSCGCDGVGDVAGAEEKRVGGRRQRGQQSYRKRCRSLPDKTTHRSLPSCVCVRLKQASCRSRESAIPTAPGWGTPPAREICQIRRLDTTLLVILRYNAACNSSDR